MSDELEEHHGLIDDDPALDYILYKEMKKEDKGRQGNGRGGCLSLALFMPVPLTGLYLFLDLLT